MAPNIAHQARPSQPPLQWALMAVILLATAILARLHERGMRGGTTRDGAAPRAD